MPRPRPTRLYHVTHVSHLASIVRDGLVCDAEAHAPGRLAVEVGNVEVKQRRRRQAVTVGAGGCVADYVPFYFSARNLMLFQIHTGRVPTYQRGQAGLVFLCTTLERVVDMGLNWVASDRNASTSIASFSADLGQLDAHVDWPLATTSTFKKTPEDPDRPQRHQAELLVHNRVPWEAIMFVGVRHEADLAQVDAILGTLDGPQTPRDVRPHWYF